MAFRTLRLNLTFVTLAQQRELQRCLKRTANAQGHLPGEGLVKFWNYGQLLHAWSCRARPCLLTFLVVESCDKKLFTVTTLHTCRRACTTFCLLGPGAFSPGFLAATAPATRFSFSSKMYRWCLCRCTSLHTKLLK